MLKTNPSKLGVCSGLAFALSLALIGFAYWARTPAAAEFNKQIFEPLYTAGALLMIGFYCAVFFGLAGSSVTLAILAWVRQEAPIWMRWAGTLMPIIAPFVAMSIIKER